MKLLRDPLIISILFAIVGHHCVAAKPNAKPNSGTQGLKYEKFTVANQSANDKRQYASLVLKNQLQAIIVSDPNADASGVALGVQVGNQADPKYLPGLAHFCEHMVFVGSSKYPKANDFDQYLADNSGLSNAGTSYSNTQYYFKSSTEGLDGALDRFSQFFISPSFSPKMVKVESNSVQSEFARDVGDPYKKMFYLQKFLTNSSHPYSRFDTGNLESLQKIPTAKKIDVVKEVTRFHKKYYSSNIMKLVVVSNQSLDTLKSLVTSKFSMVKNRQIVAPKDKKSPFRKQDKAINIYMASDNDAHSINLQFIVPTLQYSHNDPSFLLTQFLESEDPGSLMSVLKSKGWAKYSASVTIINHHSFTIFQIYIESTPKGIEHKDEVVKLVFEAIKLMKTKGLTKKIFEEFKSYKDIESKLRSQPDSYSFAKSLIKTFLKPIPTSRVLEHKDYPSAFDPSHIKKFMDNLTPKNLRVTIVSPTVSKKKNLKVEPWYKTKYSVEPFSTAFIAKLNSISNSKATTNSQLKLPSHNPWITTDFKLIKNSGITKTPKIIYRSKSSSLAYSSLSYDQPLANLNIFFRNELLSKSPKSYLMSLILRDIFSEKLTPLSALAGKAKLNVNIDAGNGYIFVSLSGPNQHLRELAKLALDEIAGVSIEESNTKSALESQKDALANFGSDSIDKQIGEWMKVALIQSSWKVDDLIKAANSIKVDEVKAFKENIFKASFIEAMAIGNIEPNQSKEVVQYAEKKMKVQPKVKPNALKIAKVPKEKDWVYEIAEDVKAQSNSAIAFYLELCQKQDYKCNAYSKLLLSTIYTPVISQLRYKEELGYVVEALGSSSGDSSGIIIKIQSEKNPAFLESRIEIFLDNFIKDFKKSMGDKFKTYVDASIKETESFLKLKSFATNAYINSMQTQLYDYGKDTGIVKELKKSSLNGLIDFMNKKVKKSSLNRHKLSLHFIAAKASESYTRSIKSPVNSKKNIIIDIYSWKSSNFN